MMAFKIPAPSAENKNPPDVYSSTIGLKWFHFTRDSLQQTHTLSPVRVLDVLQASAAVCRDTSCLPTAHPLPNQGPGTFHSIFIDSIIHCLPKQSPRSEIHDQSHNQRFWKSVTLEHLVITLGSNVICSDVGRCLLKTQGGLTSF